MPEQTKDTRTLEEALRETAQRKWQGRRCYATNMSQAQRAIDSVEAAANAPRLLTVGAVEPWMLRRVTSQWYAAGLSPATINKRLNCLSAMGVSVEGCRVREPKVLKWWLKPEDEKKVCAWLAAHYHRPDASRVVRDRAAAMTTLVLWTTRTGLRIEETLRLTRGDFHREGAAWAVTVPGLKTSEAQATLPLGQEAADLVETAFPNPIPGEPECPSSAPFVPVTYDQAVYVWDNIRAQFGWQDNPTATLKALRRSAARHLHVTKGMPLDMVRQYLRHEDIETTMGYLRLTGGYGTEEMRKWL